MKRGIIELITGIIFLAGLTFKFAHYPGAALLLVLGLSLGSILLLAQFFKGSSKDPLSSLIYKLSIGNGTMYILGVLFKVMHWPGASFLLVVSMLTMSILLAFSALKTRTWYYALLPQLFSVTLLMALFKIMHWPQPNQLLFGSYFAFSVLLICVLFYRAKSLKKNEASLVYPYTVLGGFVFMLFLVELKLKYAPNLFEIADNSTRLVQSFLMAAIIFGIQRMLLKSSSSKALQNDFRILKTIQSIYLIMLIMMTLVAVYN